jgi:hypothetical protein
MTPRPVVTRHVKSDAACIAFAILLAITAPDLARADRYRVEIMPQGPSVYVNDATTLAGQFLTDPGVAPVAASLVFPGGPVASTTPPAAPAGPDGLAKAAQGPNPAASSESGIDPDGFLAAPGSAPDAAFIDRLRTIYDTTDPVDVGGVWRWYLGEPASLGFNGEPASLGFNEKVGNAVIRFALATNRPISGARVTGLNPLATTGTVRTTAGVQTRSTPWGPATGAIPDGTPVTLIPPAEGPWYRVSGAPGGDGWVSGLWLDLR